MESFRANMIQQIEKIDKGIIFSISDLSFAVDKTPNVCVLLSELSKKGLLKRFRKGAYYKPNKSLLGLGELPLFEEAKINFILQKYNGYITGAYAYNKLNITNQVPHSITIACSQPLRIKELDGTPLKFIKAYVKPTAANRNLLILLDAIKDADKMPGLTPVESLQKIAQFVKVLSLKQIKSLSTLVAFYPPRTIHRLCLIFQKIGYDEPCASLKQRLNPTSKFSIYQLS